MANLKKLKYLRNNTGVSIALCNKALTESKDDLEKAKTLLQKWGLELADKKQGRLTSNGVVSSYVHHNKRVGSMIVLCCETDFVASNKDFIALAYNLAMQIASMKPKNVKDLLKQKYIKDSDISVADLIKQYITKLGENIKISEFTRFDIQS